MTNFEKIKQMSVEKMAKVIEKSCEVCCIYNGNCTANNNCTDGIKRWLESEAEK